MKTYTTNTQKSHHFYITNLATTQLLNSVADTTVYMTKLFDTYDVKMVQATSSLRIILHSARMFAVLFIIIDRILTITFGNRYMCVWNGRKSKIIIFVGWFIHIVMLIFLFKTLYETHHLSEANEIFLLCHYASLIVTSLTLVASMFVLGGIFTHLWRYRWGAENVKNLTFSQVFYNSGYMVDVLLVTSYLLLTVVPEVVYSFLLNDNDRTFEDHSSNDHSLDDQNFDDHSFRDGCFFFLFSTSLSNTAHAFIYIFKSTSAIHNQFRTIFKTLRATKIFRFIFKRLRFVRRVRFTKMFRSTLKRFRFTLMIKPYCIQRKTAKVGPWAPKGTSQVGPAQETPRNLAKENPHNHIVCCNRPIRPSPVVRLVPRDDFNRNSVERSIRDDPPIVRMVPREDFNYSADLLGSFGIFCLKCTSPVMYKMSQRVAQETYPVLPKLYRSTRRNSRSICWQKTTFRL